MSVYGLVDFQDPPGGIGESDKLGIFSLRVMRHDSVYTGSRCAFVCADEDRDSIRSASMLAVIC